MKISGQVFFLLSVLFENKVNITSIFGALGKTWRYNFYMGMQNDVNLEK